MAPPRESFLFMAAVTGALSGFFPLLLGLGFDPYRASCSVMSCPWSFFRSCYESNNVKLPIKFCFFLAQMLKYWLIVKLVSLTLCFCFSDSFSSHKVLYCSSMDKTRTCTILEGTCVCVKMLI